METASSLMSSSTSLLSITSSFGSPLFQETKLRNHKRSRLISLCRKRDAYDRDSGGRLVDENMIVLRKRIHEMKVAEKNYEAPSTEWMDWEKQYYASYGSDVSQLMGMLQAFLLNTRPGLALGLAAIITVSVPASVIVIVLHLLKVAMSAVAGGGAS